MRTRQNNNNNNICVSFSAHTYTLAHVCKTKKGKNTDGKNLWKYRPHWQCYVWVIASVYLLFIGKLRLIMNRVLIRPSFSTIAAHIRYTMVAMQCYLLALFLFGRLYREMKIECVYVLWCYCFRVSGQYTLLDDKLVLLLD